MKLYRLQTHAGLRGWTVEWFPTAGEGTKAIRRVAGERRRAWLDEIEVPTTKRELVAFLNASSDANRVALSGLVPVRELRSV